MKATADRILPDPDSLGTPDRWGVLSLVAANYFILYAHRSLINYVQQPLMADLELSESQFGWLGTAFSLPYAVAQIGVGFLGDRFPRRTILIVATSISLFALAGMGLATGFAQMAALRVLLAVAQSACVPAIASAMADSFTSRSRSTAVGIFFMSYNVALIVAGKYGGRIADIAVWRIPSITGGEVWEVAGWRMCMFIFAGAGAFVVGLFWLLFREPPRNQNQDEIQDGQPASFWPTMGRVLQVPTFWTIMSAFVLTAMVILAVQLWLPGYFKQRFDLTSEEAGTQATGWIQMATIAGLYLGGLLGDRFSLRWIRGRTAVQMAGLALAGPAILIIGLSDSLPLTAIPMLAYGLGVGLYQANLWVTAFEVVDPACKSTAIGLLNVASGVFGLWCNPLIGAYQDRGGDPGVALASLSVLVLLAFSALAFGAFFLLPKDYRGTRPGTAASNSDEAEDL